MKYSLAARKNMVTNLLMPLRVKSPSLLDAFMTVPRELFVPEAQEHVAYTDRAIALHPNRTALEPSVLARMLEAIDVNPSDIILDIACGMGYSTALFSLLANKVFAVESISPLTSKAHTLTHKFHLDNCMVIHLEDMKNGYSDGAPYDVIFVNGALTHFPESLIAQLSPSGRIIAAIQENPHIQCVTLLKRNGTQLVGQKLFESHLPLLAEFDTSHD